MNDLLVVMGASCVRGTMELYRRQLAEAGIESAVEDISDNPNLNGGGSLAYRIKAFRRWIDKYSHYTKLIFSDAFDVTFYGKREEVLKKIPVDHVLHAAEKNCYPDPSVASRISGKTPWKFFNGGLSAGTPQAFAEWCFAAECHPGYKPDGLDQGFMNERLADGHKMATIDSETKLFYCLFGGYSELDFTSGIPINTACCTWPNFLHANGKWSTDEMFKKYERSIACIQS